MSVLTGKGPYAVVIGDEFQGVYESLGAALDADLMVRLRLAGTCELRFGLGWGEITAYDPDRAPMAQSGPAWWAAVSRQPHLSLCLPRASCVSPN